MQYEFLDVYVAAGKFFDWDNFKVLRVEGKSLAKTIPWREYRDARGREGYSLAGFVIEQNFGANVGFIATFQRPINTPDVQK